MNSNLLKAKELLKNNNYTCVLVKGDTVYTSCKRGVMPLLEFYKDKLCFEDFSAADKVVGKAAAYMYVLLGVREIFALVVSEKAKKVLEDNEIKVYYDCLTNAIKNRTNTALCPLETATANIDNPTEALDVIEQTLKKLNEAKL